MSLVFAILLVSPTAPAAEEIMMQWVRETPLRETIQLVTTGRPPTRSNPELVMRRWVGLSTAEQPERSPDVESVVATFAKVDEIFRWTLADADPADAERWEMHAATRDLVCYDLVGEVGRWRRVKRR